MRYKREKPDINMNTNSVPVLINDAGRFGGSSWERTVAAIRKHRDGNRAPVWMSPSSVRVVI